MKAVHLTFWLITVMSLRATNPALADVFGSGENAFEIQFVTIGNPGNGVDAAEFTNPDSAGAVDYIYNMGRFEVSRAMVEKASAEGGLGLTLHPMDFVTGGPRPDMPATGVSWNEAARFTNWLNASQGFHEAYKFDIEPGDPGYDASANVLLWQAGDEGFDPANPVRNSQAKYFLPSLNEWYKAAYYDPNANGIAGDYWTFPTGSDTAPTAVASGTDQNTAVFDQAFDQGPADVTRAGGLSPYGVMGLGGNVMEWQGTVFNFCPVPGACEFDDPLVAPTDSSVRGGYWNSPFTLMPRASGIFPIPLTDETGWGLGFRVASIPEPSSQLLGLLAVLGILVWRRAARYPSTRSLNYARCPRALLFTFLTLPSVAFSQTVYNVVPRELSNGYRISEGGTITVTGGDITGWEIPVLGEFSFTFSSTSRIAELSVQNVEITASAITVPAAVPGPANFLSIRTQEFFPPSCAAECFQFLSYGSLHPSSGPFAGATVSVDYRGEGLVPGQEGEFRVGQPVDWVVATAVPEPSGHLIVLPAIWGLQVCRVRRRQVIHS